MDRGRPSNGTIGEPARPAILADRGSRCGSSRNWLRSGAQGVGPGEPGPTGGPSRPEIGEGRGEIGFVPSRDGSAAARRTPIGFVPTWGCFEAVGGRRMGIGFVPTRSRDRPMPIGFVPTRDRGGKGPRSRGKRSDGPVSGQAGQGRSSHPDLEWTGSGRRRSRAGARFRAWIGFVPSRYRGRSGPSRPAAIGFVPALFVGSSSSRASSMVDPFASSWRIVAGPAGRGARSST